MYARLDAYAISLLYLSLPEDGRSRCSKAVERAAEAQKGLAKLYLAPTASRRVVRTATDEIGRHHSIISCDSVHVRGILALGCSQNVFALV